MMKMTRLALALFMFLIGATLSLLTAPTVTYLQTQAQPTTAATPFEQLSQQQPSTATAASRVTKPGTILLTTFPNGTSKAQFANGTTVQILSGVGYLVLDPSASAAASASASAHVSNTVVNRFYQAIAIAIGITINATEPDPIIPIPPQPNTTEPRGPDQDCLFDPSLSKCTPGPEGCPQGFGTNEDGQCFPLGGCPDGYHSVEDDESGTCYPESTPCPDGQVRSEEGNYCIVPPEPEPEPVDCAEGLEFNPQSGECEPFSLTVQGEDEQEQGQQLVEEPVEETEEGSGEDDNGGNEDSQNEDGSDGGSDDSQEQESGDDEG